VYRLASNSACKQKLPGFVGQFVMVTDGKIYRRMSESEVPHSSRSAGAADAGIASPSRDRGDGGVQQAAK
jgi:hypothetical protein